MTWLALLIVLSPVYGFIAFMIWTINKPTNLDHAVLDELNIVGRGHCLVVDWKKLGLDTYHDVHCVEHLAPDIAVDAEVSYRNKKYVVTRIEFAQKGWTIDHKIGVFVREVL